MANKVYNETKYQWLIGGLNLGSGGDDIRAILVMANSTCDAEVNAQTIAGFTTLDHCDSVGYMPVALTGEAAARDSGGNRGFFDAGDVTFPNLQAGTRQMKACLLIKWMGSLNASIPLAYIDTPGFPFYGNGSSMVVQWNLNGILQIT